MTQMETTTEKHNLSKCRVVEHSCKGHSYNVTPAPKVQGPLQKRGGKIARAKKLAVRLHLLEMSTKLHPRSLNNMAALKTRPEQVLHQ